MIKVFVFIAIGLLGIFVGRIWALLRTRLRKGEAVRNRMKGERKTLAPKEPEELKEMREESREALTERTEKRKEKILYLMNSETAHQEELKACGVEDIRKGITSKNIEKLLGVSGATARKYLNELEDENKIKQIGEAGRGVFYVLNT